MITFCLQDLFSVHFSAENTQISISHDAVCVCECLCVPSRFTLAKSSQSWCWWESDEGKLSTDAKIQKNFTTNLGNYIFILLWHWPTWLHLTVYVCLISLEYRDFFSCQLLTEWRAITAVLSEGENVLLSSVCEQADSKRADRPADRWLDSAERWTVRQATRQTDWLIDRQINW